jgi:hypothetical protein
MTLAQDCHVCLFRWLAGKRRLGVPPIAMTAGMGSGVDIFVEVTQQYILACCIAT